MEEGMEMSEREQLRAAIAACIPEKVVTWPTPYDRRWGLLDDVDRIMIVNSVLAVLDQQGWVSPEAVGERVLFLADCANTPLMRDVMAERDAALADLHVTAIQLDDERAALREAARYEPSEWSCSRSASGHRLPHHAVAECDGDPSCVPLYRQVTEGEEG